jgi:hypothetical protein
MSHARVAFSTTPIAGFGGGLVAADRGLAPEVRDHGVEDRLRHEPGAGVVEVRHVGAARRVGACPGEVDSGHVGHA